MGQFILVIKAHREEDEEHDEILENTDDLDVRKGELAIEQITAQAAKGPEIGRQCRNEVTAAVVEIGKVPLQP